LIVSVRIDNLHDDHHVQRLGHDHLCRDWLLDHVQIHDFHHDRVHETLN
jgi:hypothetical protein